MKPEKYTIMFIPDDESGSKSFHLSKSVIQGLVAGVCILLLSIVTVLVYYVPQIANYNDIKKRHDFFASERLKVLELTRDIERVKQMDELVRKSLGATLNIDKNPIHADSTIGTVNSSINPVSFIDNIPSVAPIQGYVSQRSSKSRLFIKKAHHGIDIVAKEGEPILAAASGVVVFSGWTYEFGNLLILYHGDNYFTHYGHNQQNFKKQMDIINRGEVIGLVGNTGISLGPHLHFEVWRKFKAVDPLIYFPEYAATDLTSTND